jgi:hypothetical protein
VSDTILRSKLIRLAHAQPDLRPKLLPLIQREARQMPTKSFDEWVKGKSFTNPETKNKVKFNSLPKAEQDKIRSGWESKNKGKSEGGKAKGLGELLDGWHDSASDPIYQVSSFARAGKPIKPEVAEKAIKKIKTLMTSATGEDKKDLGSALKELESLVKADGGDGAKEPPKAEAEADAAPKAEKPAKKAPKKPAKTYKKNYGKAIEKVLDAHKLTDADMDDVLEFKKDRPRKGRAVPPAELMRRFLEKAKPETKERMKGMNPNDFVKLLGALFDEEEGGTGKTASADAALRSGLIRLAYQRPELRPKLLPLISKEAKVLDKGDGAEAPKSPDGRLKGKSYHTSYENQPQYNKRWRADQRELISKEAATPTYKDYVEKKRKDGEKPMEKAEWEAKVLGKGDGAEAPKSPIPAKMYEYIGPDAVKIGDAIKAGKPVPKAEAKKVVETLETALKAKSDGKAVIAPNVLRHYKSFHKFLKGELAKD